MKKLILPALFCVTLFSCGETKTPLEEATDLRCACLSKFDKEKDNLMDVLSCIDEINNNKKFSGLDRNEIATEMGKKCPDSALPMNMKE